MYNVKKEPGEDDAESIKADIMELVLAYENGISETELSRSMTSVSVQARMNAINALANEGKVQLCKRGSDLIYRAIDSKSSANHSAVLNSNISLEERAVYQVVESAGCKGIWNREIRNQTKLPLNQMSKVLKNLETKKLIKAVKSVTASKKKLYMLYDLEPDKSVTGGAWYSGAEFESEYVQILHEQCYNFVKRQSEALVSSSEVKDYIDKLNISNVKLSLEDIEMVLETIVFDGLIEKININQYRALAKLTESTGVMRTPCGQCPYIHECRPSAVINPEKCLYFERWF